MNLINVHELGTPKTRNPTEVAKHAAFMAANMLVAVSKHVRVGGRAWTRKDSVRARGSLEKLILL